MTEEPTRAALLEENRALRERIAALEREREEEMRRSLAAVAEARSRAYWLDRWRIDLDRLMDRPSARQALEVARRGRRAARRARGLLRR